VVRVLEGVVHHSGTLGDGWPDLVAVDTEESLTIVGRPACGPIDERRFRISGYADVVLNTLSD
jgi:hypothetical protein